MCRNPPTAKPYQPALGVTVADNFRSGFFASGGLVVNPDANYGDYSIVSTPAAGKGLGSLCLRTAKGDAAFAVDRTGKLRTNQIDAGGTLTIADAAGKRYSVQLTPV